MTSQALPLQAINVVDQAAAAVIGETRQFVTITLGAQHYCVDITSVREIRAWSAITPLSEASIQLGGESVEFPDFTRGKWMYRKNTFALDDQY